MDIYEKSSSSSKVKFFTPAFLDYLSSNKNNLNLYDVSNYMEGRKKLYTSHGEGYLNTFIIDQEEALIMFLTP